MAEENVAGCQCPDVSIRQLVGNKADSNTAVSGGRTRLELQYMQWTVLHTAATCVDFLFSSLVDKEIYAPVTVFWPLRLSMLQIVAERG
jgi:hypothetical protein